MEEKKQRIVLHILSEYEKMCPKEHEHQQYLQQLSANLSLLKYEQLLFYHRYKDTARIREAIRDIETENDHKIATGEYLPINSTGKQLFFDNNHLIQTNIDRFYYPPFPTGVEIIEVSVDYPTFVSYGKADPRETYGAEIVEELRPGWPYVDPERLNADLLNFKTIVTSETIKRLRRNKPETKKTKHTKQTIQSKKTKSLPTKKTKQTMQTKKTKSLPKNMKINEITPENLLSKKISKLLSTGPIGVSAMVRSYLQDKK